MFVILFCIYLHEQPKANHDNLLIWMIIIEVYSVIRVFMSQVCVSLHIRTSPADICMFPCKKTCIFYGLNKAIKYMYIILSFIFKTDFINPKYNIPNNQI